jgi:hypothetical protein
MAIDMKKVPWYDEDYDVTGSRVIFEKKIEAKNDISIVSKLLPSHLQWAVEQFRKERAFTPNNLGSEHQSYFFDSKVGEALLSKYKFGQLCCAER